MEIKYQPVYRQIYVDHENYLKAIPVGYTLEEDAFGYARYINDCGVAVNDVALSEKETAKLKYEGVVKEDIDLTIRGKEYILKTILVRKDRVADECATYPEYKMKTDIRYIYGNENPLTEEAFKLSKI